MSNPNRFKNPDDFKNLDNLKKQAKQFVRWHRERHWPVAEQIRSGLPAFSELTDREVFEATFQLADAQQLVAQRAGVASWADLKIRAVSNDESAGEPRGEEKSEPAAARGLAHNEKADQPEISGVQPFLFVADVQIACDYYRDVLGFDVRFVYGEPAFYGQIERGAVVFSVRQVDAYILEAQRTRRAEEELLVAMIDTDNAKALSQEFVDAGASVYQTLRTEPWGAKSFIVQDPDANLVGFTQPGPP